LKKEKRKYIKKITLENSINKIRGMNKTPLILLQVLHCIVLEAGWVPESVGEEKNLALPSTEPGLSSP
jgi:hypothetical protein